MKVLAVLACIICATITVNARRGESQLRHGKSQLRRGESTSKCGVYRDDPITQIQLQSKAATLLRGLDWICSNVTARRERGEKLWERLVDFMADDFTIGSPDIPENIISSKQDFMDNAADWFRSMPRPSGSMSVESFPVFECRQERNKLFMTISFNTHEAIVGEPWQWIHCEMTFIQKNHHFKLLRFEFDVPNNDAM
eukprot:178785_1